MPLWEPKGFQECYPTSGMVGAARDSKSSERGRKEGISTCDDGYEQEQYSIPILYGTSVYDAESMQCSSCRDCGDDLGNILDQGNTDNVSGKRRALHAIFQVCPRLEASCKVVDMALS